MLNPNMLAYLWITILEMISELQLLIDRDDLPSVCLVTFQHTEFEEAPVIPIIFLIHMERMESMHSFLFSRVAELVPEITVSKKIISAIMRRRLPMLYPKHGLTSQCFDDGSMHGKIWNFNWENYASSEKKKVSNYKNDFIYLLLQKSERSYKSVLARLYLKWEKVGQWPRPTNVSSNVQHRFRNDLKKWVI